MNSATVPKFIMLDNKWFDRDIRKLGHLAFAIYTLILVREARDGVCYFTIKYLVDMLTISTGSDKTIKQIKKILQSLQEYAYIDYIKTPWDSTPLPIILSMRINDPIYAIPRKTSGFTMLYTWELYKILSLNHTNEEKRGLLAYLCCIFSHINSKTHTAFPTLKTLGSKAKIGTDNTCIKYNNLLAKLNIIIFENTGVVKNYKGQWVNGPNVYARPIHKSFLLETLTSQRKLHSYKVVQADIKQLSNTKRSITQQIHYIEQGREWHELTDSEQQEITKLEQKHTRLAELQQEQFEKRKKVSKKLNQSDRNTKKSIPSTPSSLYSDDDW